jgi:hypothetical protein
LAKADGQQQRTRWTAPAVWNWNEKAGGFLFSSSFVGSVLGVEQNISLECVRVKNLN